MEQVLVLFIGIIEEFINRHVDIEAILTGQVDKIIFVGKLFESTLEA